MSKRAKRGTNKETKKAINRITKPIEEDSSEDDNTTSTPNFFMELLNEC